MTQKNKQKFSRNIYLLGATSFLNDVSSDMVLPIFPIFITLLHGGGLAIGLIGGIGDSLASFLKAISGYISDKVGKRKPIVFGGYSISSISRFLYAFATSWKHLLILRPMDRVGKGIRTSPRDAIIAESIESERRGWAFGFHRALDSAGAVVGSFLTLVLLLRFDIREIILIAGILGFLSLIPLSLVKDVPKKSKETKIVARNVFNPRFVKYIVVASIFSLAFFTPMFFILKATQLLGLTHKGIILTVSLYILFNLSYTFLSTPIGKLSDRIGRKKIILAGYINYSLVCLSFYSVSYSMYILPALFLWYGFVYALLDGMQRAFVVDLTKPELKATALGIFNMCVSMAMLPGNVIAGILWNYNLTFLYGCLVALFASILLIKV